MYLTISIILQLTLLVYANPFHKYPFVFLLDIGNEELDKTNTEQIRISVPGGSLALRYPAVGDGDTIAHVRVSGIDFGTDLKANIVDGGPGYKYVILVFMGNPGVAYDAVITMQTVPNDGEEVDQTRTDKEEDPPEPPEVPTIKDGRQFQAQGIPKIEDDPVRYAETKSAQVNNAELTASASNYYPNNEVNDDDNNNNDSESQNDEEDFPGGEDGQVKDYLEENNLAQESFSEEEPNYDPQASPLKTDDSYDGEDEQNIVVVDPNLYKKYEALKPHLSNGDTKVYPEGSPEAEASENRNFNQEEEDPVELDQMFNDEEVHNDAGKYTDDNNNSNFDTDDSNAVEY